MFGNKKDKKIKASRISTIVGQGTEIHGNISFTGGLHVDGIIKGNVNGDQTGTSILSLSELGLIEGEVRVPMVILNGSVLGNVFASERIELAPKSKVTGDVTYNLLEMVVGAEVNGRLLHKSESTDEMRVGSAVKLKPDPPKKEREDKELGNVFASERIELAPKSKVTGDVTYNLIEMAPEAEVNGRLLHKDESPDEMRIGSAVKIKSDPPKKEREDSALSKS